MFHHKSSRKKTKSKKKDRADRKASTSSNWTLTAESLAIDDNNDNNEEEEEDDEPEEDEQGGSGSLKSPRPSKRQQRTSPAAETQEISDPSAADPQAAAQAQLLAFQAHSTQYLQSLPQHLRYSQQLHDQQQQQQHHHHHFLPLRDHDDNETDQHQHQHQQLLAHHHNQQQQHQLQHPLDDDSFWPWPAASPATDHHHPHHQPHHQQSASYNLLDPNASLQPFLSPSQHNPNQLSPHSPQYPHHQQSSPSYFPSHSPDPSTSETFTLESGLVVPVARTRPSTAPGSRRPSPKSKMAPKRLSTSGASTSGTPAKSQKVDDPQEFSRSVQSRLLKSTRTGQACDRCKIRKIRCDGLQGGCSPCIQNKTECRTTDRLTGVATSRGYVQNLEVQNKDMAARIRDLESQLTSMGVDVKPSILPLSNTNIPQPAEWGAHQQPQGQQRQWPEASPSLGSSHTVSSRQFAAHQRADSDSRVQETNLFRALPVFRTTSFGENYLGVSSDNSRLSSINGTSLSLLGVEIDIADFPSPDIDEPPLSAFMPGLYNKSYQSLLQTMYNINPKLKKPELPERSAGLMYAEWYFRVIGPYLPILHQPTFTALLYRMYDDPAFRPSAAETVMVHMVFAIMLFQYAARNFEDTAQQPDLNSRSNVHYHYALSFFYDLRASHTLQDIQALALICSHLRNFPKPGASWHVTNATLAHAIEQGLHRSSKTWATSSTRPNYLEEEMRKRVFYSVLCIHVLLSGKLGRPMALRLEDFDIELPESIDDEYISETGIAQVRPKPCSFQIGIEGFRYQLLSLQLYTTLYSVKRDAANYEATVERLEESVIAWRESVDPQFKDEGQTSPEGRVFAVYTKLWYLELRLLLRHPATSLSTSKAFNNESLNICADAAACMLEAVKLLQKYKSLDTTWYNGAVCLMAITTTLFVTVERYNAGVQVDLARLRNDMNSWADIMGDIGILLGSGRRLQETVRLVTEETLNSLGRGSGRGGRNSGQQSKSPDPNQPTHSSSRHGSIAGQFGGNGGGENAGYLSHDPSQNPAAGSSAYQNPDLFAYPDPSSTNPGNPYGAGNYGDGGMAAAAGYGSATGELNPTSLASVAAAATIAAGGTSPEFGHPSVFPVDASNELGSLAWRQWTGAMAGSLEPSDAEPASALMSLRDLSSGAVGVSAPMVTMEQSAAMAGQAMSAGELGTWPHMVLDLGNNPGMGG